MKSWKRSQRDLDLDPQLYLIQQEGEDVGEQAESVYSHKHSFDQLQNPCTGPSNIQWIPWVVLEARHVLCLVCGWKCWLPGAGRHFRMMVFQSVDLLWNYRNEVLQRKFIRMLLSCCQQYSSKCDYISLGLLLHNYESGIDCITFEQYWEMHFSVLNIWT